MPKLIDIFPYLLDFPRSLADLSPESDLETLSPERLKALEAAVVQHLLEAERQKLRFLLPRLQANPQLPVEPSFPQKRSRHALSRANVRTWGDIGEHSAYELRRLPGVGGHTAHNILIRCVQRAMYGDPNESCTLASSPFPRPLGTAAEGVAGILRTLTTWWVRERNTSPLSSLLKLNPECGALPADIQELWTTLANLKTDSVGDFVTNDALLEQLVDELLGHLKENARAVYEMRVLADRPATLEDVGQKLGFTRERARQIQLSAQQRIDGHLASDRFRPLRWRASALRSALGLTAPVENPDTSNVIRWCLRDVSPDKQDLVLKLLLHLAGPYRNRDGWFVCTDFAEPTASDLGAKADDNGLLPVMVASEWLSLHGIDSAFHQAWIERSGRFRQFGSNLLLWSGSVVDKCIAVLAMRGIPTDPETLLELVGEKYSVRATRNRLFEDQRLVRVNRNQWGLRSWGLEPYTGITDEIAQRVVALNGRAPLADIMTELARQFDVRESSVRIYASAPMFVLEGGFVRFRREDEPYPVQLDFALCRGAYHSDGETFSYLIPVDRDMLRGSGRPIPAPVAGILGVQPGRPRTFRSDGGDILVTWPKTAALGPSLGSVRGLANIVGATSGDHVRLDFHLLSGHITAEHVPSTFESIPPSEALRLLTGVNGGEEPVGNLASALRVSPGKLRRCLSERGDSAVAALLPSPQLDPELDAALCDLAQSLDALN